MQRFESMDEDGPKESSEKERSYVFVLRDQDVFTQSTVDLRVVNGVAVDPQSCHVQDSFVYRNIQGDVFSAYLAQTDVENRINSYYKLQILQSYYPIPSSKSYPNKPTCWLFQTRGSIGGASYMYNETEMSLRDAIHEFKRIFAKLTGNSWELRSSFEKKIGMMNLLEIEYTPNIVNAEEMTCNLSKPVREVVELIVSKATSSEVPKIQSSDSRKWPLGQVSARQIEKAFEVLDELLGYVTEYDSGTIPEKSIIRSTDLYYSLVPRSVESGPLRVLNTLEAVQTEFEYLDSLPRKLRILSPVDSHYANLSTKLRRMDPNEEMYNVLALCVQNTGASNVQVVEIFELERHGDNVRYQLYENLHKKLLWHGSPLRNFSKILSQGLIIRGVARGGSFGLGIYFSDCVHKAMTYCGSVPQTDRFACLLVCQVAIGRGEVQDKCQMSMRTASPGYESVFAPGTSIPDPKDKYVEVSSGAELSFGKLVEFRQYGSNRLHNEYIVYNEGQVKMRFLVKVART